MKNLHALVLTPDYPLTHRLQAALEFMGVTAHFENHSLPAIAALMRQHYDGLLVDFDALPGAELTIVNIRAAGTKKLPIVALLDEKNNPNKALNAGANLAFCKSAEAHSRRYLRVALLLMTREHLRYSRYPIQSPAVIRCDSSPTVEATTFNVSSEGVALQLSQRSSLSKTVNVRFQLPTSTPAVIRAVAQTAWIDSQGRLGLRFLQMPEPYQSKFRECLAELHKSSAVEQVHSFRAN